jgi:hypothetical protein
MSWRDYIPFLPKLKDAEKPKLKICCACPETKVIELSSQLLGLRDCWQVLVSFINHARVQAARDECIAMHGTPSFHLAC